MHHFILAKLLRFQRTFPEKFFGPGLGQTPQFITLTKNTAMPCFLYLALYVGTAFQTSFSYFSYKKSKQKNFPPNTPLYFCEAFEFPRNFSRKVSWSFKSFAKIKWCDRCEILLLTFLIRKVREGGLERSSNIF